MDTLIQLASQYGPLGLIVLALFFYILKRDKDQKDERKQVVDTLAKQHAEALEVTRNNTSVLSEISTLIKIGNSSRKK